MGMRAVVIGDCQLGQTAAAGLLDQLDRIEAAFNTCDKNKSGTIEGKEIKKVLESIGINGDKKHVKEALAKFDDDGSKSLDLAEFTAMVDELKVSEAAMAGVIPGVRMSAIWPVGPI